MFIFDQDHDALEQQQYISEAAILNTSDTYRPTW